MKAILERDVESYFVSECKKREWEVRKVKWLGRDGAPDRVVFAGWGNVVFVELKRPGKEPEPHQIREIGRMRIRGANVEVIDSYEAVDGFVVRYS